MNRNDRVFFLKRSTITEHTYRLTQNNTCIYENGQESVKKTTTSKYIHTEKLREKIDEFGRDAIEHCSKTNASN